MGTGNQKQNGGNREVINLDYLEQISGGEKEFINEMVQLFLDNTPKSVREMKEAMKNNDPVKLGEIAHKMKPSAIYMGNEELAGLLRDLQELKNTKKITGEDSGKLQRVDELSNMVMEELRKI